MSKFKKIIFLFLLTFICPLTVSAIDVRTGLEFINALGGDDYASLSDSSIITLKQDVTLSETVNILEGEYTLNFNGKKIVDSNNSNYTDGKILYVENAKLTLDDNTDVGGIYVQNSNLRVLWTEQASLYIKKVNINGGWNPLFIMNSKLVIDSGNFISTGSSAMYSYGSDITINDGYFEGNNDSVTISISDTVINNGTIKAIGTDESIGLHIDIGNCLINGGSFIGNKAGATISVSDDSNIKLKGGTYSGLKYDTPTMYSREYSAGILMYLSDGRDSEIDVTYLLEEKYQFVPSDITLVENYGDFYSATSKEVKVEKISFKVINTLTNIKNTGSEKAYESSEYETILKSDDNYILPDSVTVKVNGVILTEGYTYDKVTGKLVIDKSVTTGDIEIIADAILNDIKKDENIPDVPSTNDNIITTILIGGVGLVGLIIGIYLVKKDKVSAD